jgi:hypothetical protein
MKIIYKNSDESIAIIHPTSEALKFMTIEEIALKDVPTGLAFAIIEDSEIPLDRTFRDAWVIDSALLTGGIGADYGVGSVNLLIGYDELRNPIIMTQQEYEEYSA